MKKLTALGIAATMAIGSLTGCGSSSSISAADIKAESRVATDSGKTADLTVGMIASVFGIQNYGDDVLIGLELIGQELEIKGIPLEAPGISGSANSICTLISQGATFIMIPSSEYKGGMLEVAAENPDVKFLYLAEAIDGVGNVMSVAYCGNEAAFLGSALAGMMTKTNNVDAVMAVGETPQYHYQFGFPVGVKTVNPDCGIRSAFTDSYTDVGQGSEVAEIICNKGADFIGTYAGTCNLNVFSAAKDAGDGKHCLGATNGQSDKTSDEIVASVVELADQVISSIIRGYMKTGEFDISKPMSLDLKGGGVKLLFTSSDGPLKTVPEDVMSAIEDLMAKMESGEIKAPVDESEFSSFAYSYTK